MILLQTVPLRKFLKVKFKKCQAFVVKILHCFGVPAICFDTHGTILWWTQCWVWALTSVGLSWLESRGKNLQHSSNGGLVPQSSLSIATQQHVSWRHFLSWHTGALLQGCTDNMEQKTGSYMDPTRSWLLSCHRYRLFSRSSLFKVMIIITGILNLSWINIYQSN